MIEIFFKKLDKNAKEPVREHKGDAGWDVTAVEAFNKMGYAEYKTGLAFAVPKGYYLMLAPRSSVYKTGMAMANSVGIIDSGYRGEVKALFYNISCFGTRYEVGDRVAQIIPRPCKTDEVEFVEVLLLQLLVIFILCLSGIV